MIQGSTERAEVFDFASIEDEMYSELRLIAAQTLNNFRVHAAGGGSEYVEIGDIKIRFADHENISWKHDEPDYNCVNRDLTPEEIDRIRRQADYPPLTKKIAFSKHFGLSWPRVKKILSDNCFEKVVLDPLYPNTRYEFVRTSDAAKEMEAAGHMGTIPVSQERWTEEDYCGES